MARHSSRGAGTSSTVEYSPAAAKRAKRKRRRQQEALDAKCARLAGPVIITYRPPVTARQPETVADLHIY